MYSITKANGPLLHNPNPTLTSLLLNPSNGKSLLCTIISKIQCDAEAKANTGAIKRLFKIKANIKPIINAIIVVSTKECDNG